MKNAGFSKSETTHPSHNERFQVSQNQFPHPSTKAVVFTPADLHQCLYKRNEVTPVSEEELKNSLQHKQEEYSYWCKGCHQEKGNVCQKHSSHQELKAETTANNNKTNSNHIHWPYALESFPSQVGLCTSGIPGAGYGVCARQFIPTGTWIGPYEGVRVRPDQVSLGTDATYMWEIYHEGKLLYYIDGHDESKASWMRYIRCARHGNEQNMFAFQYCGNVYYKAFRDIPPGTELLVWYDEKYPQYMGIPLEIRETFRESSSDLRQHPEMTVTLPRESLQGSAHAHFPSSTSSVSKRNRSYDYSRVKHRSSRSVSVSSVGPQASLTGHDSVNQASRTYTETEKQFNSQVTGGYSSNSISQVVSHGAGRGVERNKTIDRFHDVTVNHGGKCNEEVLSAEEYHIKYSDEEDNSSDSTDATVLNCGQCGKSFAQRSVLQIHVCPNRPYKPYHCGHCNQSFDYPNELRMHAVIHAGEKPFKCGYCSRSFAGATTLHNHVRTHTGEKPFLCERCGKTFTQASQLHKHEGIPGDCLP